MANEKSGRSKKSTAKKSTAKKSTAKKVGSRKTTAAKKSVSTITKAKKSVPVAKTAKNVINPRKTVRTKKSSEKKVVDVNATKPSTQKKSVQSKKSKLSVKTSVKSKAAQKSKQTRAQKETTVQKSGSKPKTALGVKTPSGTKSKIVKKARIINKEAGIQSVNKKKSIPTENQSKLAKGSRKKGTTKNNTSKPEVSGTSPSPSDKDLRGYSILDFVVYPSHGVGQIQGIEEHEVGDQVLTVFVVEFDKEKMTLRVPFGKVESSGMRKLSSQQTMERAIATLKGRARTRRVMWSRRAADYDLKLNSGDPVKIAEVVRDLYRNETQPDQSYSERQMYEAALERLAREYAAMENTNTEQATEELEKVLQAA